MKLIQPLLGGAIIHIGDRVIDGSIRGKLTRLLEFSFKVTIMQVKQLSPTEISELIKQRIEHFDLKPEVRTEGTIVSVKDGIVRLYGLPMSCKVK